MNDLAAPRAVSARAGAGLYESHYLTAWDPSGGRALWLRHTSLKRPGEPAHPTVWLVWFDRSDAGPNAVRVTAPEPIADPGGDWARSALGRFGPSGAEGAIDQAGWALSWVAQAPELPYLPARWLYDRPIPRSNGTALVPAAAVTGTVALDGREPVALEGWNGMVGHNWGSEHADRWTWIHAGGLGADGAGWLDLILVRVQVGPLLTPWMASGALTLDGVTYPTARRGRVRRDVDGDRTEVSVPLAGGAALQVTITAPGARTVAWDYAGPRGAGRVVRNCSIADATLTLRSAGSERVVLVDGAMAVEHGEPGSPSVPRAQAGPSA